MREVTDKTVAWKAYEEATAAARKVRDEATAAAEGKR